MANLENWQIFPFYCRERAVAFCDNTLLPLMLQSSQQNIELTGGSSILTEFGLCKTTGGNIFINLFTLLYFQLIKSSDETCCYCSFCISDEVNIDCLAYMDLCDEYLTSWVEWDYTGMQWYPGGNLDWNLAQVKQINLLLPR